MALIFDLDGVIVHSNAVHSQVWREYLASRGVRPPEDFEQKMFGMHNDAIVRAVLGEGFEPAAAIRLGAEKEALYRERMRPVLRERLVAGLERFLETHRNTRMAVATNGERANADFVLDAGCLRQYFQLVIDGSQVRRPKPDPEIYLRAAERLEVPPADCVVFEDSLPGVAAARAAGTRVVGVRTTHSELPGVALSIRDFDDPGLEPWLSAQQPF